MSARERQRGKVKGRKEEAREQVENREEERTGENERTKRTNWEGVRWLGRGLRPRGRRDEPGGSQRPKITAMTFAFSHSPPRVPLWTRCLFSFRDLFLLSNPPIFSSLVVHLSFSSSLSLSLSLFSHYLSLLQLARNVLGKNKNANIFGYRPWSGQTLPIDQ